MDPTDVSVTNTDNEASGPPNVAWTSPSNDESHVEVTHYIKVGFDQTMDPSTITVNTIDTTCSGSIQVSSDNFSSCVQIAATPTTSDNTYFKFYPKNVLSTSTQYTKYTYKIKVTTAVQNSSSVAMTGTYTSSDGFSTEEEGYDVPDTGQTTSYAGTSAFDEDADFFYEEPVFDHTGVGAIEDEVTGLMWQEVDSGTTANYTTASAACTSLNTGGFGDWR